jgi:hypothetical protein
LNIYIYSEVKLFLSLIIFPLIKKKHVKTRIKKTKTHEIKLCLLGVNHVLQKRDPVGIPSVG